MTLMGRTTAVARKHRYVAKLQAAAGPDESLRATSSGIAKNLRRMLPPKFDRLLLREFSRPEQISRWCVLAFWNSKWRANPPYNPRLRKLFFTENLQECDADHKSRPCFATTHLGSFCCRRRRGAHELLVL